VDGAAAVVIASGEAVRALGLRPRARIVTTAVVGSDPVLMLTGPFLPAGWRSDRAGWTVTRWTSGRSTRPSPRCPSWSARAGNSTGPDQRAGAPSRSATAGRHRGCSWRRSSGRWSGARSAGGGHPLHRLRDGHHHAGRAGGAGRPGVSRSAPGPTLPGPGPRGTGRTEALA
jgi:hypothetical protein